ncbi:MAG: hypothetical protein H6825_04875 [Planctomycetes bacterium]|nr:hypothetical protein [Planctomycetota bacterium]
MLLLGVFALFCALLRDPGPVTAAQAGDPVALRLEDLSGEEYRLLPGVGPVLAGRLEQARVRAGGRLDEATADAVPGVGDGLLRRWQQVRPR